MTKERIQGHIAIFGANVIFGIYIPMSKFLLAGYLSSEVLTLVRMWGAAILFWLAGLFVKEARPTFKDLFSLFVFSLFGIVLNQGLFIYGLGETSPIDASVIVTATPLMVMVIAAVFMRDPVTKQKLAGVFVGATGAVWLVLSAQNMVSASASVLGDAMILSSGLATAIYYALSKPLISRHSPIVVSKWMFLFSAVMLVPFTPSAMSAPDAFKGDFTPTIYFMMLYVVIGATFITYLLIAFAIKRLRSTTLAMYNYVQPFISSCAAVVIGQDVFSWQKLCAAAFVFLGVYLVTTSPRPNISDSVK